MRYNMKRWYADQLEGGISPTLLEDCERLEVIKQAIKAIDNAQNFEAVVSGPEKEALG